MLFWSRYGHVACEDHVPLEGSDDWKCDQWEPMPTEGTSDASNIKEVGCDTCRGIMHAEQRKAASAATAEIARA